MRIKGRWLIGLVCALYLALRLWRVTDACLWFDEIFGVHAAEHSWGGMFWFVAQDLIHPPFFYALLKLWIAVGGEGLLWLRLFPVLFSAAAVVPFLYLCRELKLKASTTVIALSFFAVNGSLIKYAQEVRMYSLLLCLSLFSIWLFARFFYRGKNIWILTLVNVLLIHTHYFGWLVVLSEIAVIAVLQRIKIRHVLIMGGIATVSFIPWALTIWRAARAGSEVSQNIGWIKPPGFRSVFDILTNLIEPFYFPVSSIDPATVAWVSLPLLVLIVSASLFWFVEWKVQTDRERIWILALFVLVPVASALVLSLLSPYSIWGARHLIVIFAPAAILTAVFLTEVRYSALRRPMIGLVCVLTLAAGVQYIRTPPAEQIWCAWEALASEIPTEGPQTVYAFEDLSAYHLWFATRSRPNVRIVKVDDVPGMIEDKAYFLPRGFAGVRRVDRGGITEDRFWVAFRDLKWNEKHPPIAAMKEAGYEIASPIIFEAGGMKGLLVELEKR